jgi:hypothetical protein
VGDGDVEVGEGGTEEFAAMAVFGFAFAAHEGNAALLLEGVLETADAFLIPGFALDFFVVYFVVGVAVGVGRTAAELVAEEEVADANVGEGTFQTFFREVRFEFGVGGGTNVYEVGDLVLLEDGREALNVAVAVADGVDGGGHVLTTNWGENEWVFKSPRLRFLFS